MIRDSLNRIRPACKAAERGPPRAGSLSTHRRGGGAAPVTGTPIAEKTLHAFDRYLELQRIGLRIVFSAIGWTNTPWRHTRMAVRYCALQNLNLQTCSLSQSLHLQCTNEPWLRRLNLKNIITKRFGKSADEVTNTKLIIPNYEHNQPKSTTFQ